MRRNGMVKSTSTEADKVKKNSFTSNGIFRTAILSVAVFLSLALPFSGGFDLISEGKIGILTEILAWYGVSFAFFFGINTAQVLFVKHKTFPLSVCIIYGLISIPFLAGSCPDPRVILPLCLVHPIYICAAGILAAKRVFYGKDKVRSEKSVCAER